MQGATAVEGVLSLDFLLICVIYFAGTGSGITVINNLASICQSLGTTGDQQDVYVSLLSVFNCCGRMFFGLASDYGAKRMSRPLWVTACVGLMCLTMVLFAFSNLSLLYLGAMLSGFSYGGFWSLGPTLIGERFGARAFASINAVSTAGVALGSFSLSATMAARNYQAHITNGGSVCLGVDCWRSTFIALAAVCAVGTAAGLWLTFRLRPLYVGPDGKAIQYAAFIRAYGHAGCTAAVQRALLRLCCCRAGRSLVVAQEDDEEEQSGAYCGRVGPGVGGLYQGRSDGDRDGDGDGGGGVDDSVHRKLDFSLPIAVTTTAASQADSRPYEGGSGAATASASATTGSTATASRPVPVGHSHHSTGSSGSGPSSARGSGGSTGTGTGTGRGAGMSGTVGSLGISAPGGITASYKELMMTSLALGAGPGTGAGGVAGVAGGRMQQVDGHGLPVTVRIAHEAGRTGAGGNGYGSGRDDISISSTDIDASRL